MERLNPVKTGLAVGFLIGLFHLCWAILVALGWAQPVIDFMLHLHFIAPFIVVQPFAVGTAAVLVALTGGIGFVVGAVFAGCWNRLHPAGRR